ncbi:unnamed protein product, partial [Symbiodinium sp. CCMP2456]
VDLLAGVRDRHGRPLLGSPDEGKEPGAPRSLPGCSAQLKALLRRVALEMHRLLQTSAGGRLHGDWSHELLLNFYTCRGLPLLYEHKDLSALTLLLIPATGGSRLLVRRADDVLVPLSASSWRRKTRSTQREAGPSGALLAGTRFSEALPAARRRRPTPHQVKGGVGPPPRQPRLSLAFFYCRERTELQKERLQVDTHL